MGSTQSKSDNKDINNTESDDEYFHDAVEEPNMKEIDEQNNLENFQTDAVKSKRTNIFNPPITYETMRDIECELSFYEKVSLAFLIYDQEDIALQFLLIEKENIIQQQTTNILLKWAESESSWKKKIIEGLTIIQNYCVLERLGYSKDELKASHLPTSPYTSTYVNILKKALYCFAESLTVDQIRLFLNLLEIDFQKKGLQFIKFDDIYVEMYLLQCFSVKHINQNDISNIVAILKKMNLNQQIEMLETALRLRDETDNEDKIEKNTPSVEVTTNQVCDFNVNLKINNKSNENTVIPGSCTDDYSVINTSSLVTKKSKIINRYKVDNDNVGICLIINQYKFYVDKNDEDSILAPSEPLENRTGTEFDRDKLETTFSKYNFRIIIRENLTSSEIATVIQDTMKMFSQKDSCFVVCILSHGQQGCIFGVNSIPVYISEIKDILHDTQYPALLGKPKILIIQSCQGKRLQQVVEPNYTTDGVRSHNPSDMLNGIVLDGPGIPQKRDLLLVMSTVSGFASIRDKYNGTWFIQELCNVIEEHSDEHHFEDIITIVIDRVSEKRWPRENKVVTMVPQKDSTFSKQLHLPKIQK